MLAGLLMGLIAGALLARREPHLYLATGSVTIPGGGENQIASLARPSLHGRQFELRQQALYNFRSVPLLTRVAVDLGMLPASSLSAAGAEQQSAVQRQALSRLGGGYSINIEPDSEVVTISFLSGDPQFSAAAVNRLIFDSIDYNLDLRFRSIEHSARWPNQQLVQLKQEVEAAENHLLDVQRQLNLPLYNSGSSSLDQSAVALGSAVTRAQISRVLAQDRYEQLERLSPEDRAIALEGSLDASSVGLASARDALLKARATLAARAASEGPGNPDILRLHADISSLEASLDAEQKRALLAARGRFLAAERYEDQVRGVQTDENRKVSSLGETNLKLNQLRRDFFETRLLYTTLFTRVRTVSIDAGLRPSQISLLNLARVPSVAIMRPWWHFAWMYGAMGLLAGTVIALALTNLRVSSTEHMARIEEAMSLPALAALPTVRLMADSGALQDRTAAQNLQLLGQPQSAFSEGIRMLRDNLRMTTLEQEPRFILFTSATPSEGKTTVSSNYAAALAESGSPTLLIDADMHRPSLHHRFGVSGAVGLSSILSGAATLPLTVQSIAGAGGLDLLVAGPVPPAPGLLLEQEGWVALLREAAMHYEHIVIDSPPVLAVQDGVTLSRHVDAVVYVIRQNKIPRQVARRGRDILANSGAPLVGVVINALRPDTET